MCAVGVAVALMLAGVGCGEKRAGNDAAEQTAPAGPASASAESADPGQNTGDADAARAERIRAYTDSTAFIEALETPDEDIAVGCFVVMAHLAEENRRHGAEATYEAYRARGKLFTPWFVALGLEGDRFRTKLNEADAWFNSLPAGGDRGTETAMGYFYRCQDAGYFSPDGD